MTVWKTTISGLALTLLSVGVIGAQTVITPSKNNYTPAQDVELGRQAAAEVEKQLPILHDEDVTSFIASIGRRLVGALPPDLRHAEFRYSFQVVNVSEINAFALPGGPMYVNRGMIQRAHTEGEVAGVMAHELSHVALRHGTAQASKATKYELGTLAGQIIGAIIGGRVGSAVSQGTEFGLGTAFLRFSREFEREADLEGAQIMARAGYDPREMANMFKTLEEENGSGMPQWLSDHPDPGNRAEAIMNEAQMLRVQNPVHDAPAFEQIQARLSRMAPAPTTEEATRSMAGQDPTSGSPDAAPGIAAEASVAPPSSRNTTYSEGNLFRVSVPSNWRELPGQNAVTFAPEGAYGTAGGRNVFTHGAQIGITRSETRDLRTATDQFIASLARGNPNLSRPSSYGGTKIGGRKGLHTALSNVSDATGRQERIEVFTILLPDGNLFYVLGVAPGAHAADYQKTFSRVVKSIEIMD